MAKAKQRNNTRHVLDLIGLVLAAWFAYSVISSAKDLVNNSVSNTPNLVVLVVAILIVGWTTYKNSSVVSRIGLLALGILATSGATWLFGLHSAQTVALSTFSIVLALTPIFALVIALLFLGQKLSK